MNLKIKILYTAIALSVSVFIGLTLGNFYSSGSDTDNASHAVYPVNNKLEEELWTVDLVVKGTVIEQNDPEQRDSGFTGKRAFSYPVTPVTIKVDKVLYGELQSDTITYLQHGTAEDNKKEEKFVNKNEEVILLLVKTSDGMYWSYNFDDGIWKIKDGKVQSKSESKYLAKFKDKDAQTFMNELSEVIKNKTKNPEYK